MTSAVPGHGYREFARIVPACKCGWTGTTIEPGHDDPYGAARAVFDAHKAAIRRETGYEAPGDARLREWDEQHGEAARRRRAFAVIEGGAA